MITVKLTSDQYYLVRTGLDLLYDDVLTRKHFNRSDLEDCLKEADEICDLIKLLKEFEANA